LLAEKGWNVVLLEKDRHPRFHIGESLLPLNLPIFERLGVLDRIAEIGIPKYGVELNLPANPNSNTLYFSIALGGRFPQAFQVRRSEFDHILLENAASKGVTVYQETKVTQVDLAQKEGPLATAVDAEGNVRQVRCRFLVDASGRDTFLANSLKTKVRDPKHASASLFAHFHGVKRLPNRDEGNISLFWFDHGWFWLIPLKDGATSVGAVCWPYYLKSRGKEVDLERFLSDTIRLCPKLAQRMEEAELLTPVTATGNYSYTSEKIFGEDFVLIGDAATFIDPVFSTGVYMAMKSASLAAEAVDACLGEPSSAHRSLSNYQKTIADASKTISWMIYRMTSPGMQQLFMNPKNVLRVEETIISILAGHLYDQKGIWKPYLLFKCLYYLKSLLKLRTSLKWYRIRLPKDVSAEIPSSH
jgi:flavin-dependent dehydrogenase